MLKYALVFLLFISCSSNKCVINKSIEYNMKLREHYNQRKAEDFRRRLRNSLEKNREEFESLHQEEIEWLMKSLDDIEEMQHIGR